MAGNIANPSTDSILQTLRQQRDQFLRAHQHYSEGERERIWNLMINSIQNDSSSSGLENSNLQIPAHNMDRSSSIQSAHSARSAPAELSMSRSFSGSSETDATSLGSFDDSLPMGKSQSMMHWGTSSQTPFSIYSTHSGTDQASSIGMQNYDDGSKLVTTPSSSFDGPGNLLTTGASSWEFSLSQLDHHSLSPRGNASYEWLPTTGSGSTGTTTPTTTSSGELSTHSTVDSEMSNHGSTSFRGAYQSFDYFPKSSDVLDFSDTAENILEAMSTANFVSGLTESAHSQFPMSVSEDVYSPIHFPIARSAPQVQAQSVTVEEMQRSISSQSSRSTRSEMSAQSARSTLRRHETLVQSSRPLAPKDAKRNMAEMIRQTTDEMILVSQDGSSKQVARITKAPAQKPYTRPQHPKLQCPHCNERLQGFRGDHELRRHIESKHSASRKVWICVDASPSKNFLSSCKHCRNQKQYNAYYNAAAHLRRAHFHPRKRGRKSRNESERRGGKGGGNDPPMDVLKDWMKEIEVSEALDFGNDSNESCGEFEEDAAAILPPSSSSSSSSPSTSMGLDPPMPSFSVNVGSAPFSAYSNIEHTMPHMLSYSGAEGIPSDLPSTNLDFVYQQIRGSADNSPIDFSLQHQLEVGYSDPFFSV